jgi:hypothetical protein
MAASGSFQRVGHFGMKRDMNGDSKDFSQAMDLFRLLGRLVRDSIADCPTCQKNAATMTAELLLQASEALGRLPSPTREVLLQIYTLGSHVQLGEAIDHEPNGKVRLGLHLVHTELHPSLSDLSKP